MQINELVTFAADVGRGLLESGAETSRVEDTVERIIRHFYDGKSEVLVVMTGLFVTVGDVTKTVRVRRRTINLDKVSKINMMSRDIADDKIDFEEALKRFEYIMAQKPYSLWVKTVAVAFCCGFFTLLFGGNAFDGLNSFVVGAVINVFIWFLRKHHTAEFIITFSGGVVIALLILLFYAIGLGKNINPMITGAIMPLVPGLAITNAIRDIIAGDYLSGGARLFDAGSRGDCTCHRCRQCYVHFRSYDGRCYGMIFLEMFVAFAATMAFAVIFNVSRSELIFCGIAGLVAEGVYLFTLRISDETALAIFVASIAVTVLSRILANIRRMPVTVYLISGIISLVPGAGMYNTVYNIIASDYMKAMYTGIDTIKVAVAIAVGIVLVFALPNKMFFKRK